MREKVRSITLDKFADADKAFKHMHNNTSEPFQMPYINPKFQHIESKYKTKPKELTNVFSSVEKQKRKDLL